MIKEIADIMPVIEEDLEKLYKHHKVIEPEKEQQFSLLLNIFRWNKGTADFAFLNLIREVAEEIAGGRVTARGIKNIFLKEGKQVEWLN